MARSYQAFIARLKQQLGGGRELAVWIHEYCNERSDFCMSCEDYRAASGFDRVIYYGPQYWGYLSAAKVHILPNSRYPARTHSHSLIVYCMFGAKMALIGQAQAELGRAGAVSTQ